MRELTLKGYLRGQLCEFSGINSTSLYMFAQKSMHNARLRDSLCLYLCLFTEKKLRNKIVKKYTYLADICCGLDGITQENIVEFLGDDRHTEFRTIYENYLNRKNNKYNENRIKQLFLNRILDVQKAKRISNYRIYTELNLNPGNVNSFLKNGDLCKVSLETARGMLGYVNGY